MGCKGNFILILVNNWHYFCRDILKQPGSSLPGNENSVQYPAGTPENSPVIHFQNCFLSRSAKPALRVVREQMGDPHRSWRTSSISFIRPMVSSHRPAIFGKTNYIAFSVNNNALYIFITCIRTGKFSAEEVGLIRIAVIFICHFALLKSIFYWLRKADMTHFFSLLK